MFYILYSKLPLLFHSLAFFFIKSERAAAGKLDPTQNGHFISFSHVFEKWQSGLSLRSERQRSATAAFR